jgi:hypothetical protein
VPIGASPLAQFGIDDPICICVYRGVRDGLCYFEVYLTDDPDGPKAVLSCATDPVTFHSGGDCGKLFSFYGYEH